MCIVHIPSNQIVFYIFIIHVVFFVSNLCMWAAVTSDSLVWDQYCLVILPPYLHRFLWISFCLLWIASGEIYKLFASVCDIFFKIKKKVYLEYILSLCCILLNIHFKGFANLCHFIHHCPNICGIRFVFRFWNYWLATLVWMRKDLWLRSHLMWKFVLCWWQKENGITVIKVSSPNH